MAEEIKSLEKTKKEKKSKSTLYNVSGEKLERKAKFCDKCGPGIFMAEHKDRYHCGQCGYMMKK